MVQTGLCPAGLPSQQQWVSDRNFSLSDPTGVRHDNVMAAEIINPRPLVAPEGNNAAVNPSWNSTILFPGTLISEAKEARFRRKVQRLLPPGFTMSDDAFAVLYQATRAAFSSLVGPVDSATFQMIVGPRAGAPTTTQTDVQEPLNFTVGGPYRVPTRRPRKNPAPRKKM